MTRKEAVKAFQKQLSEGMDLGLQPMPVKTADDLLNIPLAVKEKLLVDVYTDSFLKHHPHLKGARDMQGLREAIEADLRLRGIL